MSMTHTIDTVEYDGINEQLVASEFAGFFERRLDKHGRMWMREYWHIDCNFDVPIDDPDYGCDTEYGEWELEHLHEVLLAWGVETKKPYTLTFTDGVLVSVEQD